MYVHITHTHIRIYKYKNTRTQSQELLALAALHDGRLPLALSALEKANTPPPTTKKGGEGEGEGDDELPPCFAYCPTALRIKLRALSAQERQTQDMGLTLVRTC